MVSSTQFAALGCALLLKISSVAAQALAEPSGNQILFGAWLDTAHDGDTPAIFNSRIGYNASVFQIAQNMPLPDYDYVTGAGGPAPEYLIEQSQTSAAVFLTVYPQSFNVTDADYTALGNQIKNYTDTYDRTVFLRFAPEMQGTWNPYGFQPVAYVQMWLQMYPAIKAIAPNVIIVWAPNEGQGYPYGQTAPTDPTELAALDTSGDGGVTVADDPFSPYYPGDEYVDWIGMSVYYKGPNYGQNVNQIQQDNFCSDMLQGIDPVNNQAGPSNFYNVYCTKANKACMFAESGAAYHVDITGGVSQLAMQQAWWRDCFMNEAFLAQFPRLKLIMQFEYQKTESDGGIDDLRDYRIVNDTAVASAFSTDLANFATRVAWATYQPLPTEVPSTGVPSQAGPTTSVCTKYCGVVKFQTARIQETGAPNLFGITRQSSAAQVKAGLAVGISTVLMLFAGSWLSGRSARNGLAQPL